MEKQRRILLYGDSIVLGSVGASLRREKEFSVALLPSHMRSPEELDDMAPDVILFDLENDRPDAVFSLLKTRPDLILLGVSPDTNVVRLWSGRQFQELSSKDLVNVIEEQLAARSTSRCACPTNLANVNRESSNERGLNHG